MKFDFNILKNLSNSELISEGSSRKVYKINNFIIKKAKNNRGNIECYNENFLYNNVEDKYKQYLCPILAYKEGIVVMSFLETISLEEFNDNVINEHDHIISYLQNEFGMDDFDLKLHFNWGKVNQKYLILDYGHNYFDELLSE